MAFNFGNRPLVKGPPPRRTRPISIHPEENIHPFEARDTDDLIEDVGYSTISFNTVNRVPSSAIGNPKFELSFELDDCYAVACEDIYIPWLKALTVPDTNVCYFVTCSWLTRTMSGGLSHGGHHNILCSIPVPLQDQNLVKHRFANEYFQLHKGDFQSVDFGLLDSQMRPVADSPNGNWVITLALLRREDD